MKWAAGDRLNQPAIIEFEFARMLEINGQLASCSIICRPTGQRLGLIKDFFGS